MGTVKMTTVDLQNPPSRAHPFDCGEVAPVPSLDKRGIDGLPPNVKSSQVSDWRVHIDHQTQLGWQSTYTVIATGGKL